MKAFSTLKGGSPWAEGLQQGVWAAAAAVPGCGQSLWHLGLLIPLHTHVEGFVFVFPFETCRALQAGVAQRSCPVPGSVQGAIWDNGRCPCPWNPSIPWITREFSLPVKASLGLFALLQLWIFQACTNSKKLNFQSGCGKTDPSGITLSQAVSILIQLCPLQQLLLSVQAPRRVCGETPRGRAA